MHFLLSAQMAGCCIVPENSKMMSFMITQDVELYIYINSILMLFVLVHQMPMGRFLLGVFVAPVLLGLLFTPIFLLDMGGLAFDGSNLAETFPAEGPVASAKRRFSAVLNIFLYAYGLKLLIFVVQWGFNIYLQVHLFIVYQSFVCEFFAWVETKIVEN